ncbi:putative membrane protein [Anaplasma phagocytophilum str. Annie]|nr:putative membrane protein [Anaplasma phagocytophilum str. Annie]
MITLNITLYLLPVLLVTLLHVYFIAVPISCCQKVYKVAQQNTT